MLWHRWEDTERQQRVVVNGAKSAWAQILSGVPQDTVLGALLLSLYIIDISIDIDSEIRLFADDCVCYREIKDTEDTLELQEDIVQLGCWARKWGMRFQPQMQYDANNKEMDKKRSMLHILWRERSSKMSKTSSILGYYHKWFAMECTSAIFALRLIGSLASWDEIFMLVLKR